MEYSDNDILEWDVLNWSRALAFWTVTLDAYDRKTARVLALGERNGGVSLWLALKGYPVVCTDIHSIPEAARQLHRKLGVQDRIVYGAVDVLGMPYGEGSFDIVVCKSLIGGLKLAYHDRSTRSLQSQRKGLEAIHRVLKKGGCWLGAENMQGALIHQKLRGRDRRLGWRHIATHEWAELLKPFRTYEVSYFGFLPTNFRAPGLNRIAYRVNCWLHPFIPAAWSYIAFVKAFK